jgi:hypothetical protein
MYCCVFCHRNCYCNCCKRCDERCCCRMCSRYRDCNETCNLYEEEYEINQPYIVKSRCPKCEKLHDTCDVWFYSCGHCSVLDQLCLKIKQWFDRLGLACLQKCFTQKLKKQYKIIPYVQKIRELVALVPNSHILLNEPDDEKLNIKQAYVLVHQEIQRIDIKRYRDPVTLMPIYRFFKAQKPELLTDSDFELARSKLQVIFT